MDQVKQILAVLRKRHFWVLCGVVLILSLVSWSSGKSFFSAEYTKQKGTISSKFSALQSISSTPNHPNQSFTDQGTVLANELKKKTYDAWEKVYSAQKPELTWLEDPQTIGELPPEGELPQRILDRFRRYFAEYYVPQLFTERVIDLVREVPVAEGAAPQRTGVIHWDQAQRDAIKNRYAWKAVPTSKAARLAQEDYWIYRSVLQTINAANAGATETHEAAVKQIRALGIAQAALASLSDANVAIEGVTDEMIVKEVAESPKVPGTEASDEELELGRYATATASAAASGEGGAGGGGSAQYKLVPVRMLLLVREAKVPDLLAACANAKLPIEVRQCLVRQPGAANPGSTTPTSAPRTSAPATSTPKPADGQTSIVDAGDVEIDLYGVIYLYNPPNRTALGMAEEGAAADEATAEEGI